MKLPADRSPQWKQGYKAAAQMKSRSSCPYNGPELRDEWLAGYDARAALAQQGSAA